VVDATSTAYAWRYEVIDLLKPRLDVSAIESVDVRASTLFGYCPNATVVSRCQPECRKAAVPDACEGPFHLVTRD